MDENGAPKFAAGPLDLRMLTSEIVAAYVGHNALPVKDLPDLIRRVHNALQQATSPGDAVVDESQEPAVSIKRSITPDYLICLEDGRKLKMLKRYLRTHFDLTPETYRAKWNLPADYPMIAPNYARKRAEMAKSIGLGRKSSKPQGTQ
ncbi:MAG: MucR family transcriptional regulator [Minwuia sp.]|uniref:MucR family transcriptional regulator n=1 Tax=Minwuia sp. TaxID=2493630 RepID=UPI003A89C2C8